MTEIDWPKRYETEYLLLLEPDDRLSWQAWAWEFLRRNPEYRNDYESYWELQLEYYTSLFFEVEDQYPLAANGLFPTEPNPKLQKQHITSREEFLARLSPAQADAVRRAWKYRGDSRLWDLDLRRIGWGIFTFKDPETGPLLPGDSLFLADVVTIQGFGKISLDDHRLMTDTEFGQVHGFAFWINPHHALDPQFKLVATIAAEYRRHEDGPPTPDRDPPVRKHLFPIYLLLLDAVREGVTLRQLADAFERDPVSGKAADEGNFSDRLGAARDLSARGYKLLVAKGSIGP